MASYYDKDGNPLELMEWAEKLEDFDYKRIASTTLLDGTWISTVWLGLDHSFTNSGPPLIFETMVFPSTKYLAESDMNRYSTLAEAKTGHSLMVLKVLANG